MPAVSVLPLRISAVSVGSHEAPHDVRLLGVMENRDEMPEFDASQPSKGGEGHGKIKVAKEKISKDKEKISENKSDGPVEGTISPSQSSTGYPQQAFPSHLTPQHRGYYSEYAAYQYQVTPEPQSPLTGGQAVYDMNSMLQQPAGFAPFPVSVPGVGIPGQAPPSPALNSVPPASPLFPRVTRTAAGILDPNRMHDASSYRGGYANAQSGRYLSPVYPTMTAYATVGAAGGGENGSIAEAFGAWGDRHQISPYPQTSPQIGAQGIPIPYVPGMPLPRSASVSSRSYSFGDDSMLPPPADGQSNDQYVYGQTSPSAGVPPGSLYPQAPPAWAYAGPPPDMYGASANPLQPRSAIPYPMAGPPRHNGPSAMGPYGQFFPASSPGPPIQTTASNKGPDGANLFIFHIPNHFTNLDMYQLFCPYGNLLSVRIMVEKDTGRSRGFGFVSYDSPESAALAIKELNGFAIGNKRLKVQHKQIRDQDLNQGYDGYGGGQGLVMTLPPSNPGEGAAWYGQPPDSMGGTEGSDVGNVDCPYDDNTGPVESGIDPLSGFDPLRQALPETGVTEST